MTKDDLKVLTGMNLLFNPVQKHSHGVVYSDLSKRFEYFCYIKFYI